MFKFLEEKLVVDCIKSFMKINKNSFGWKVPPLKCLLSRVFLIDSVKPIKALIRGTKAKLKILQDLVHFQKLYKRLYINFSVILLKTDKRGYWFLICSWKLSQGSLS